MTLPQKVLLIALSVLGAVALIVGLSLAHHIGGFLRTVEEETREQEREAPKSPPAEGETPAAGDQPESDPSPNRRNL